MAAWGAATFYPFAHVQQANPYWVQAWQWSVHRSGLPPHAFEETFQHWLYWDNVGALIIAGIVLLVTALVFGGIAAVVGEIIVPPAGPRAGGESSAAC